MSVRLVCDHCNTPADYLHALCHASAVGSRIVEDDYSQGSTHLHWECIPLWWQDAEAKRISDEEPPF